MMAPPIFSVVNVPPVQALLRDDAGPGQPLRFYAFGLAPQPRVYPYAVWRESFGNPDNNLSDRPRSDRFSTQVDVYVEPDPDGGGAALARQIAEALRDAIELQAHIVAWRGESRDPDTRNFVFSFDVDWIVAR